MSRSGGKETVSQIFPGTNTARRAAPTTNCTLQVERFFQEMKMNLNAGARCCTVEQLEASPGSIYGQNSSSFYHSLSVSLTFKAENYSGSPTDSHEQN
jgi:hypothetical protein